MKKPLNLSETRNSPLNMIAQFKRLFKQFNQLRVLIEKLSTTSNQSFNKSFSIRRLIMNNSLSARPIRDVEFSNLNLTNIIEGKRKRRSNLKCANFTYQDELAGDEEQRIEISKFHTAFMIEKIIQEKNDEFESQVENSTNDPSYQ